MVKNCLQNRQAPAACLAFPFGSTTLRFILSVHNVKQHIRVDVL